MEEIKKLVSEIAKKAKRASYVLSSAGSMEKNLALKRIAELLNQKREEIKRENEKDLKEAKGLSASMIDRLILNDKRIDQMIAGIRDVIALNDPVGEIVKMWKRPNGLIIGRMRIPIGVIGIIYESRPNVTIDAGILCIKSGNAIILRGGSEAKFSNKILTEIMREAIRDYIPEDSVQIIPTQEREAINYMLKEEGSIDLIIPRGGEELIKFVVENSKIPVIKHYKGVCHVYVDKDADMEKALKIVINAKTQRPGVCNAMETLLVHKEIADKFLPVAGRELIKRGVEIRGCEETRRIIPEAKTATEQDWYEEYLALILAVRVVNSIDEAIEHIRIYGSEHTDSIVTENYSTAMEFIKRVNSSSVMVNASTRFSDGYEYGLGAEIGISTTKIHAFGPMGLEELTTTKFIVFGNGQVRE
jgi:glutamate-5-semialdehyde dehydrogenase